MRNITINEFFFVECKPPPSTTHIFFPGLVPLQGCGRYSRCGRTDKGVSALGQVPAHGPGAVRERGKGVSRRGEAGEVQGWSGRLCVCVCVCPV